MLSADLTARTGGVPRSPQDPVWRTTDITRWARRYGAPFVDPAGELDWRAFAEGCVAAQLMGQAESFARALYAATYAGGEPPRDRRGLAGLAASAGLDVAAFAASLGSDEARVQYAENLEAALAAGAFAVPTFVTSDREVFWGQDRLPLLMDHLKAVDRRR